MDATSNIPDEAGPVHADPGNRAESFTIRDLAREFGVTARTLRFYEEKGLIAPARRGLERIYSRRDRTRLKLVLMGRGVGFSLEEIREMLDLYDLDDGGARQLRVAIERFDAQLAALAGRRAEIDRAIEELSRARAAAADMLARVEPHQR